MRCILSSDDSVKFCFSPFRRLFNRKNNGLPLRRRLERRLENKAMTHIKRVIILKLMLNWIRPDLSSLFQRDCFLHSLDDYIGDNWVELRTAAPHQLIYGIYDG
jgi:hypothetical protein